LHDQNWATIQLCLIALAFGGLQIWWIGSTLRTRNLAKVMNTKDCRNSLERIWKREQQQS